MGCLVKCMKAIASNGTNPVGIQTKSLLGGSRVFVVLPEFGWTQLICFYVESAWIQQCVFVLKVSLVLESKFCFAQHLS